MLNKKKETKYTLIHTHTHWEFEFLFIFYLFTFYSSFAFFFQKMKCGSFDLRLFYFCLIFNSLHEIKKKLFFFKFTGNLLVNQSQQRIHQITSDLHINAVQRNDSGRYTCAKINNNKQTQQVEIQKNILLEIICKYKSYVQICLEFDEPL